MHRIAQPFIENGYPAEDADNHRPEGASHLRYPFPTPRESPQSDWGHIESLGHSREFASVGNGLPNGVGQVLYQRSVFGDGLPSPSCPVPVADFRHAASTIELAQDATWPLSNRLISTDDHSLGVSYSASHLDILGYDGMQQVESPRLVNHGVEGHWPDAAACSDQAYSPMCRGDLAPETVGQPFIEYERLSGSVGQAPAVKQEPNTAVNWQVDNKPKKSLQAIKTATKPRRRGSAADDKHKVTKTNFAPAQTPKALYHLIQSFPDQHQPSSPSVAGPPRSSLRTATRKSCPPINASPKPGESAEDHHLRTTHNLVEQKYRARVQTGFEGLIEVLPGESGDEGVGSRRSPRRMSKADVLARSTYVVKTLMDENKELKRKLDEMKASFATEIKRKER